MLEDTAQQPPHYDLSSNCKAGKYCREHVFPGGHLPSIAAMLASARGTGLSLTCTTDIGPHYAVTLRAWRQAWEARRKEAMALGYSDRFWRKYRSGPVLTCVLDPGEPPTPHLQPIIPPHHTSAHRHLWFYASPYSLCLSYKP